jgi:hypothetical protein
VGDKLRYVYGNFITSAGHLILVFIALQISTPIGWIICLVSMAATSLFAWSANLRRLRTIADTPTSRVASAAQGYVELFGRAQLHEGRTLISPVSQRPCVWYRYTVEEERGSDWYQVKQDMSSETFLIEDATGRAVIDPCGAEIVTNDHKMWSVDKHRYREWLLTPGADLYALGELSTEGGAGSMLDASRDVSELLGDWKSYQSTLLKRFDLDGNNQIDMKEWKLARHAARRVVEKKHREIRAEAGINVVRRPRDGRPYLLCNLNPDRTASRYKVWAWVQLVIALAAGAGILIVLANYAVSWSW